MDKIKNYVIAILTELLILSLFTQPAQSAGKSKEAKAVEYLVCLNGQNIDYPNLAPMPQTLTACSKFRP